MVALWEWFPTNPTSWFKANLGEILSPPGPPVTQPSSFCLPCAWLWQGFSPGCGALPLLSLRAKVAPCALMVSILIYCVTAELVICLWNNNLMQTWVKKKILCKIRDMLLVKKNCENFFFFSFYFVFFLSLVKKKKRGFHLSDGFVTSE